MWRADNNAFQLTRRTVDGSDRVINARVCYGAYGISAVREQGGGVFVSVLN